MSGKHLALLLLPILLGFSSCHKPEANVTFRFSFSVAEDSLRQDTIAYVNAAGNPFSVTEVQYFISKVVLTKDDGTQYVVQTDHGIHYTDVDIPSTLCWTLEGDHIPTGKYVRLDFVFGLAPEYNVTHFFVNPPENLMSWPEVLGGGYHHMKLNGRWLSANATDPLNYCMHIGTGQMVEGEQNAAYVDNTFSISLPISAVLVEESTNTIQLEMDIAEWFRNPYIYDFATDGTSIMQNQSSMSKLVMNGQTVFTVR